MKDNEWPFVTGQEKHKKFIDELINRVISSTKDQDHFNYHIFNIDQDHYKIGLFYIRDEYYMVGTNIELTEIDQWDEGFYERNIQSYSEDLINKIKMSEGYVSKN